MIFNHFFLLDICIRREVAIIVAAAITDPASTITVAASRRPHVTIITEGTTAAPATTIHKSVQSISRKVRPLTTGGREAGGAEAVDPIIIMVTEVEEEIITEEWLTILDMEGIYAH